VFFNREWARVEGYAEERNIKHIAGPHFADWESKKQGEDLFGALNQHEQKRFDGH
jgi:hypothetical protein